MVRWTENNTILMTKAIYTLLSALAVTVILNAGPLGAPTAVHSQPDSNSAVIRIFGPGTEPLLAAIETQARTPAGWMAINVTGPFECYVQNKDIDKGLHIKPGTSLHLEPKVNSGVIGSMETGDAISITGLHGKWTQINLDKTMVGYIKADHMLIKPSETPTLIDVTTPEPTASNSADTIVPTTASTPVAASIITPPASRGEYRNAGSSNLPRLFQGKLVTTRRPFTPRRPYDWQLNDSAGVRYAYLDTSKLLLTARIEDFANYEIVVYGTPKAMKDGKNIVIQVVNLRRK